MTQYSFGTAYKALTYDVFPLAVVWTAIGAAAGQRLMAEPSNNNQTNIGLLVGAVAVPVLLTVPAAILYAIRNRTR